METPNPAATGPIYRGQWRHWRSVRKRYCELAEALGVRRVLIRSCGAFFLVDRSDLIQRTMASHGVWEPSHINHLGLIAHRFDYFIDAGANIGFYSVVLARHRFVDQVIAIEPLPANLAALRRHLALNRLLDRVQVHPFALGDADTEIEIADGPANNRSNGMMAQ